MTLRKADWWVRPGLSWEVRQLVQDWHYSKDFAGSSGVMHVLTRRDEVWGRAWGAAIWYPAVYAIRRYGVLPLQLSRLVVIPDAPKNAASYLMRRSMDLVDRATWPVLLTYADTGQGHTGAIYRATGWTEDGQGGGWNYYEPGTGRQLSSLQDGVFVPCPEGWEARRTVKRRFIHAVAASSDAAVIQTDEGVSQTTLPLQNLDADALSSTISVTALTDVRSGGPGA
jgi:hypothetical protein